MAHDDDQIRALKAKYGEQAIEQVLRMHPGDFSAVMSWRDEMDPQYTRLNLDDFVAKRSEFTDDEWVDLLVQSIGFNPARFDRRVKMLMLVRLVPFVESNFNLIELGEMSKTKHDRREDFDDVFDFGRDHLGLLKAAIIAGSSSS